MLENAIWICAPCDMGTVSPEFRKEIILRAHVKKASLLASAMGAYNIYLNGKKVGNSVLAPGFTSFANRVLYAEHDITALLSQNSTLSILCGDGWARHNFGFTKRIFAPHISVIAALHIEYENGEEEYVYTDETWKVYTSHILFSALYHGETVDKTAEIKLLGNAVKDSAPHPALHKQTTNVTEQERIAVREILHTPKGETVLDFGQNIAGYVEINICGKRGERIVLSHAEVLDKDGNFYTENMRSARNLCTYVLSGENDVFKPTFSFQGFRYVRLDEYPENIAAENFTAVVIHTDMERIGSFTCGNADLNKLYSNIIWGQKGNFVDIPTDCPQRDERLGWTGDAQVFCRTAAMNFDVEAFFDKWLTDMALEQREDGAIYRYVPFVGWFNGKISAGWSDAAVICPWEVYNAYGNKEFLRKYYPMMKKWVDYVHGAGEEEFLWLGGDHYGDWLALDAGEGKYLGATQKDFIASAYFYYIASILAKAEAELGIDNSETLSLAKNVKATFRKAFMKDGMPVIYPKYDGLAEDRPIKAVTQTSLALILHFGLFEECEREAITDALCDLIRESGGAMTTGFLGTPYILHALSDNGRVKEAYDLLLRKEAPSWLFSVTKGATTIWEHWDGIKEDGSFWSADMNSFNHYAYGSVFDWMFANIGGIKMLDGGAGYEHISICPKPDVRLGFAKCGIKTRHGELSVKWSIEKEYTRYELDIPCGTQAVLTLPSGKTAELSEGKYILIE
ncbi:MAG: family 78 glycoside hydrolase catalytic domain [Clostridia bacterium]|nr:family 78 glycoside hydrolase catalytic domain [Clostridia bacterium]